MKNSKKRGFTLVELVIVIAVIAILAAVLIPTFIGIIDNANNSADTQLVANMNTVLVTDIDADSTATAENLRKLLKDNGITNFDTKKSDNIIVYDQAQNRFKLVNLSNAEIVTEAEASASAKGPSLVDTVVSNENRLVVAENPFSPYEIFKGYTVVSTGGNNFAENLYGFHDAGTLGSSGVLREIWNSGMKGLDAIKESLKKLIGVNDGSSSSGTEPSHPGTMAFVITTSGVQSVKKYKFNLTNSGGYNGLLTDSKCTSIDKIMVGEELTELDLSIFTIGAVVIIPNTVESVKISDENVDLSKTLFVGNTQVLHEYAKDRVNPEIEGKETEQAVLCGAQVGAKSINEIKESVTQFGSLIHETEFYLVKPGDERASQEHYYTDINEILKDVGNSARYSGQQRDLIVASDYTISQDIVIPTGVTLQVPFIYANDKFYTGYGDGYTSGNGTALGYNSYVNGKNTPHYRFTSKAYLAEETDKKYDLTLEAGHTITVQNGGGIVVGGVVSHYQKAGMALVGYQGHTSGYYGQITNNGTIILESGSELEADGFIKGSGTVEAKRGSKVTEPLVLTDFHNVMDAMLKVAGLKTSPFFGYSVMNINSITLHCGAVMYVRIALVPGSSTTYEEDILVGYDLGDEGKTDYGLLVLKDENSAIKLEYFDGTSSKQAITDDAATNLHGDIGITKMTLSGTVDTGHIGIYRTGGTPPYAIDTASAMFPIPYNFEYAINGTFNVYNRFAVLPGAEVTVAAGGNLNIMPDSEFYVLDYMKQGGLTGGFAVSNVYQQGCKYPTAEQLTEAGYSASGVLTVNGTMTINANATVGGIVRSTAKGAKLEINSAAKVKTEKFTIGGVSYSGCNTFECSLSLRLLVDGELVEAEAGKKYESADTSATKENIAVEYKYAKEDAEGEIKKQELINDETLYEGWTSWPVEAYKMTSESSNITVQSNNWSVTQ